MKNVRISLFSFFTANFFTPCIAQMSALAVVRSQASAPVTEPYVQVTSVTVEPSAIHKTQQPNTASVIVQILLRGQAPPNPEAIVEVGTYSSDPANNELKYENPTRTVSLKNGVTVIKFKLETAPKTFQGKIGSARESVKVLIWRGFLKTGGFGV